MVKKDPRSELPCVADGEANVRVHMISLGCPKNLVDSEMILGNLFGAGGGAEKYSLTFSPEDADVIVVNTCGFIDSAKEESINTILEACELKRTSDPPKRVIVTGCLAQRYGTELRREVPEVDAILGLGEYDDFAAVVGSIVRRKRSDSRLLRLGDPDKACQAEVGRFRLTPSHFGYVKISEGCDNPCTFCAIPAMRGRFRSKPISMVEAEARELAQSGAREIVIIAQDTTSYGFDLDGRFQLPALLERLSAIDGVDWIRVLYAYPAFLSDDMLRAIATLDKVVNYLDMPLQHISERMLRRMGRRLMERKTRSLLERVRELVPGIYLRTTFIVGFPGETEDDFEVLRDFVREFRFERLGVFPYSEEEGTPAAGFDDALPEGIRADRLEELMLVQQRNAFRHNTGRIGETVEVLVDRVESLDDGRSRIHARSFGESPEIDPVVLIESPPRSAPPPAVLPPGAREIPLWRPPATEVALDAVEVGDFLTVRITGSRDYDMLAAPVDEAAPSRTRVQ